MKDFDDFVLSVEQGNAPSADLPDLLQALWWAKKGNWEKAHDIAQDVESSNGSWVHAYLHRVEGDLGNAAYWYSRAGRPAKRDEDMNEEWKEIAKELVNLNI